MPNKISTALNKFGLGKMSRGEYQANLSGMNTFFGAVLGFVLTGTEKLNNWQLGFVLMALAATVISISSSFWWNFGAVKAMIAHRPKNLFQPTPLRGAA